MLKTRNFTNNDNDDDLILPARASESAQAKKLRHQTADESSVYSFTTLLADLASRARTTILPEPIWNFGLDFLYAHSGKTSEELRFQMIDGTLRIGSRDFSIFRCAPDLPVPVSCRRREKFGHVAGQG